MKSVDYKPSKLSLVSLLLASTLVLMGGAAVAPALPLMSEAFPDVSETLMSFIVTLPSLAIVATGFLMGWLADRFGRVPILTISLIIFTIGGVSAAFIASFPVILIGRVVLGIGIAGIITTTTALIADYYGGLSRMKVLGYQGAAMGIGALVLEISGGLLASVSWQTTFLIYFIGIAIMIPVIISLRDVKREPVKIEDVKITESTPNKTPGLLIFLAYLTIFADMAVFYILPSKLPYLSAELGGNSTLATGILLGFMGCFVAISGLLYWRVAKHVPRLLCFSIGFLLLGGGCIILGFSINVIGLGAGVILTGLGSGLVVPSVNSWLTTLGTPQNMGKIMGGYSMGFNIGQFVSSLIAALIIGIVGTYSGMFTVFGLIAIAFALIWCISFFIVRARKPVHQHP